jgi:hypothetical protein
VRPPGTGPPVPGTPGLAIVGPPKNPCPGWSHNCPAPKTPVRGCLTITCSEKPRSGVVSLLCDLLSFKIFMVQTTRLYNLICRTCVKSSVVWGVGPVVRRFSPQPLPQPVSRRPPTHTSDSVPIDVHPTPTSLQFRVLYTYVRMHPYILGAYRSSASPVLLTKNDPSIYPNTTVAP